MHPADQTPRRPRPGTLSDGPTRGRGANINPANRFEKLSLHVLGDHLDHAAAAGEADLQRGKQLPTEVYRDRARTIINPVDSPDIGFKWTINPYRGCEHGCVYCYARPGHETLGFSSGVDFESKIMAKTDAPDLLRKELARPRWAAEPIVMSGVTDCYQPIEAKLRITRRCLEVFVEARQPVSIVTKSRLILRDLDLLGELAEHGAVHAAVSVTSLDNALASKLEPRAASPSDRLETIRRLASAGVPVTVMVAPLIPAINDREAPAILQAAADAGATSAGYVLLRLPYAIKDLFDEWLERHFPARREHVLSLLRQSRGGKLYDPAWNTRMKGQGPWAEHLRQTFRVFAARAGLDRRLPRLNRDAFRRPRIGPQLDLFT